MILMHWSIITGELSMIHARTHHIMKAYALRVHNLVEIIRFSSGGGGESSEFRKWRRKIVQNFGKYENNLKLAGEFGAKILEIAGVAIDGEERKGGGGREWEQKSFTWFVAFILWMCLVFPLRVDHFIPITFVAWKFESWIFSPRCGSLIQLIVIVSLLSRFHFIQTL